VFFVNQESTYASTENRLLDHVRDRVRLENHACRSCVGSDNLHRAVAIIRQPTGREVMRFEDFDFDAGGTHDLEGNGRIEFLWFKNLARITVANYVMPFDGPYAFTVWPLDDSFACNELIASMEHSNRPVGLKDAHVKEMERVAQQATNGEISRAQAQSEMEPLARELGADAFGWLVRRVPVYDDESQQFMTLDT
jgi:hypothetical protein